MRHTLLIATAALLLSCSDDSVKAPPDVRLDLPGKQDRAQQLEATPQGDRNRAEARAVDLAREAGKPAEAGKPGEAGLGPCGGKTCAGLQVCVGKSPVGPATVYTCEPVPKGCEGIRTCACLGPTLCVGAFNICTDVSTPNTILCECPSCQ